MTKYQVIWKDVGEEFDEDAFISDGRFTSADWAVTEYCEYLDSDSNFVDGYPEDSEFWTKNIETGEIKKFNVSTDWSPDFYAYEKENT